MFSTPKRIQIGDDRRVALVFPHWGARRWAYVYLIYLLNSLGYSSIIYFYPDDTLSDDLDKTKRSFKSLLELISKDCENLGARIKLAYGVSLGTIFSMRIARVYARSFGMKVVLNLSGASLPYAVWNGASTRHIRAGLERRGTSYAELETALDDYSPIRNLEDLERTSILFMPSLSDTILCADNVERMRVELSRYPRAVIVPTSLPHKLAGIVNMLQKQLLEQFLQ